MEMLNERELHFLDPRRLVGACESSRPDAVRISDTACPTKFTEITITKISAENSLIGTRLGWVLTLNGFLFASYGLTLTRARSSLHSFPQVLAVTGMLTSLIALIGVLAAYSAINAHKKRWNANRKRLYAVVPQPFSDVWPSLTGRVPSIGFCCTLFGVWLWLLIAG
jgi:hypothetical protein